LLKPARSQTVATGAHTIASKATEMEHAKAEEARARLEYAEARNRSETVSGFEGDMLRAWPNLTPNEKREMLAGFVLLRGSSKERLRERT
jgi:hypothetical protein